MSAYVVITADDKQGTVYPEMYGPFSSDEEAVVFASKVDESAMYVAQTIGGYYGVHVISDSTVKSPSEWKPFIDWDDGDEIEATAQ